MPASSANAMTEPADSTMSKVATVRAIMALRKRGHVVRPSDVPSLIRVDDRVVTRAELLVFAGIEDD